MGNSRREGESSSGRHGNGRDHEGCNGRITGRGTEPSKGRGGLRVDAIIEVAIRVPDPKACPAVSIRCDAAELDARAMSLEDHFDNKDDQLAAKAEEVGGGEP